jgi:hypothetical protein
LGVCQRKANALTQLTSLGLFLCLLSLAFCFTLTTLTLTLCRECLPASFNLLATVFDALLKRVDTGSLGRERRLGADHLVNEVTGSHLVFTPEVPAPASISLQNHA